MPDISNDFLFATAIAGVAIAALAIGLVIGLLFSGNRAPSSTMGYSIDRDDRGRISGILALPSLGGMVS